MRNNEILFVDNQWSEYRPGRAGGSPMGNGPLKYAGKSLSGALFRVIITKESTTEPLWPAYVSTRQS
jgi:hypothetical protein